MGLNCGVVVLVANVRLWFGPQAFPHCKVKFRTRAFLFEALCVLVLFVVCLRLWLVTGIFAGHLMAFHEFSSKVDKEHFCCDFNVCKTLVLMHF